MHLTHFRAFFSSYRNQSIDLLSKSIDWSLHDGNIGLKYLFHSEVSKKKSKQHFYHQFQITDVVELSERTVKRHSKIRIFEFIEKFKEYIQNIFVTHRHIQNPAKHLGFFAKIVNDWKKLHFR